MATTGDIYRLRVYYALGDLRAASVRTFRCTFSPGPSPSDTTVAQFWRDRVRNPLRAVMSTAAKQYAWSAQRVWPLPAGTEVFPAIFDVNGIVAGDPLPPQVCGLIYHGTLQAGQHARGLTYVPFPGEADNTAAYVPSASYLTRLAAVMDAFGIGFSVTGSSGTADFQPVVWTRGTGSYKVCQWGKTRSRWATQRRRTSLPPPGAIWP